MNPDVHTGGFPHLLRTWRRNRRLSRLQLALAANVSQRHISLLESGRAQPSRAMILLLSHTLDVPLRDRNSWLVSAGFAPIFPDRPFDDPHMSEVLAAVRLMFGDDRWSRTGGPERNLLRAFFHPSGLRPLVANWSTIAPLLWHRALRETASSGGQAVQQLLGDLAPYQDAATISFPEDNALLPVVLEKDGLRLSLFTVTSTFGTAQDGTAQVLRIESLFPADETTARVFRDAAA